MIPRSKGLIIYLERNSEILGSDPYHAFMLESGTVGLEKTFRYVMSGCLQTPTRSEYYSKKREEWVRGPDGRSFGQTYKPGSLEYRAFETLMKVALENKSQSVKK